jgi:hypothetical protein
MNSFEIFKSLKGRKTFIVTRTKKAGELREYAKKHFRAGDSHIIIEVGYLYKGQLYLEEPEKKGVKACLVASYQREV